MEKSRLNIQEIDRTKRFKFAKRKILITEIVFTEFEKQLTEMMQKKREVIEKQIKELQ